MIKTQINHIVSIISLACFLILAVGSTDDSDSSTTSNKTKTSSTCDNIAGYYSGSLSVGYTSGTASLNISNNCKFTFTQNIPGFGMETQYGKIQKSGSSSYRFIWDDGSNYTVSLYGNSISITGYNWSANLRK